MRRSTDDSAPVFNRVVIARVATDLLASVIKLSRSRLQAVTAAGWVIATLIKNKLMLIIENKRNGGKIIRFCCSAGRLLQNSL